MSSSEIMQIIIAALVALGTGAGVYAAIKADITRAIVTSEMSMLSATRAHERIDNLKK